MAVDADTAPETKTRPAPPPLIPRDPECPICHEETRYEDDGYLCENCNCWWGESGCYESDGEWADPDLEQCAATVQPYLDNTWVKDDAPHKHEAYRCVLDAGHDNVGPSAVDPHAHPDMTACAKGWR